jgi:hypothetical protein
MSPALVMCVCVCGCVYLFVCLVGWLVGWLSLSFTHLCVVVYCFSFFRLFVDQEVEQKEEE